jgi:hypothetical protein
MVALEYCHFTVDVWWRSKVVTSLLMCGGVGMLSLYYERVVALCPFEKQHFISLR